MERSQKSNHTQLKTEAELSLKQRRLVAILTIEEVARYLRVHPSTIYRLLKQNELPAFKVGRNWRIKLEAVNEFTLAEQVGSRKNRLHRLRSYEYKR